MCLLLFVKLPCFKEPKGCNTCQRFLEADWFLHFRRAVGGVSLFVSLLMVMKLLFYTIFVFLIFKYHLFPMCASLKFICFYLDSFVFSIILFENLFSFLTSISVYEHLFDSQVSAHQESTSKSK